MIHLLYEGWSCSLDFVGCDRFPDAMYYSTLLTTIAQHTNDEIVFEHIDEDEIVHTVLALLRKGWAVMRFYPNHSTILMDVTHDTDWMTEVPKLKSHFEFYFTAQHAQYRTSRRGLVPRREEEWWGW